MCVIWWPVTQVLYVQKYLVSVINYVVDYVAVCKFDMHRLLLRWLNYEALECLAPGKSEYGNSW